MGKVCMGRERPKPCVQARVRLVSLLYGAGILLTWPECRRKLGHVRCVSAVHLVL